MVSSIDCTEGLFTSSTRFFIDTSGAILEGVQWVGPIDILYPGMYERKSACIRGESCFDFMAAIEICNNRTDA